MKLKILTPERVVVEDDVDAVYGMTEKGMVGILPKHVPLVTPLALGVLHYVKDGAKQPLAVMGGIMSTDGECVTILSDAAEMDKEIDAVRAQHAVERAEARLRQQTENVDTGRAQLALARALVRLKASGGR